jgi:hypothetical protein
VLEIAFTGAKFVKRENGANIARWRTQTCALSRANCGEGYRVFKERRSGFGVRASLEVSGTA